MMLASFHQILLETTFEEGKEKKKSLHYHDVILALLFEHRMLFVEVVRSLDTVETASVAVACLE